APDGSQVTTAFPRKVYAVMYAPSSRHLLVLQSLGGCQGPMGIHLLDSSGHVLWSKTDERSFRFSTTGQVIYARPQGLPSLPGGNEVELFDLAGRSLRSVTLPDPVYAVVVPGSGERIIIITEHSVVCVERVADRLTSVWSKAFRVSNLEAWA